MIAPGHLFRNNFVNSIYSLRRKLLLKLIFAFICFLIGSDRITIKVDVSS